MKVFNTIRSFITYITLYVIFFIIITGNNMQHSPTWVIIVSILLSIISAHWIYEKLNDIEELKKRKEHYDKN